MDGATSDLKVETQGKTLSILPYARGYFPRHTLYEIWQAIECEKVSDRIFWDPSLDSSPAPVSMAGDLTAFVTAMNKPTSEILIGYENATATLAGLFWFSELQPTHQAIANIWVSRAFHGSGSREFSTLCLDYGFAVWNFRQVWVTTPWPEAKRLAMDMGFEVVGMLEDYVRHGNEFRALHFLRLTKENWEACRGRIL